MEILTRPSLTAFRRANLGVQAVTTADSASHHEERRHGLSCHTVTTASDFLRLEEAWTELATQCRSRSPFSGWDFAVEWWRHFVLGRVGRATGRFQVVVVRDEDDAAVGIVPFYEELTKGAAGVGLRLQPFGRSYSFEPMSDEPIAMFHREHERTAVEAVRAYLTQHARAGIWDIAVVRGPSQRPGDPAAVRLTGPGSVRVKRYTAEVMRTVDAPLAVRLPRRWDLFSDGLSKSMRDNLSYYPKRLDREVGAWAIRAARTPPEVALATEALIALHRQRSRSAVGKPHCDHIPTATHAAFMRCWFQRLARRGAITVMVFETSSGIRAAQAFLKPVSMPGGDPCSGGARHAHVYYSGHGEDVYRFSALTLLTAAWFRLSVAEGLASVRFPPGSASWSGRWGARPGHAVDELSIYAMNGRTVLRAIARRCSLRMQVG